MYVIILIFNAELRDPIKIVSDAQPKSIEYSPWQFSIIFEFAKNFETTKNLKRSMKLYSLINIELPLYSL